MNHPGPICSVCTRDWDERLGYCQHCQPDCQPDDADEVKEIFSSSSSLHDQLVASIRRGTRRSNANTPGMFEDNFS